MKPERGVPDALHLNDVRRRGCMTSEVPHSKIESPSRPGNRNLVRERWVVKLNPLICESEYRWWFAPGYDGTKDGQLREECDQDQSEEKDRELRRMGNCPRQLKQSIQGK